MVLESLINPILAESKPWRMVLYGMLYSTVGIFLSLWIFEDQASLVMVFLTTMATIPLIYNTIRFEEQKDESISREKSLLREHSKALEFFIFIFIGMVISMSFWYVVLPNGMTAKLFAAQTDTISRINGSPTGNAVELGVVSKIFINNLQVLVFSLLFAFLYGVGAIFILAWNASVIAAAIGNLIKTELAKSAAAIGMAKVSSYFHVLSLGVFRYSIHGIPEILAYFIAGLAGGIISVAMLRKNLDFERFKRVVLDTSDLMIISVMILLAAALLEVFVTPLFF